MSSVKNFLRRQVDVNHYTASRGNQNQSSTEVDQRPLSEYDNLQIITTTANTATAATSSSLQPHFPLADIKFRFDDLNSSSAMSSSAAQNSNSNNHNTPFIPSSNNSNNNKPKYENVIDTLQMRNKRENDQRQVKIADENDGNVRDQRPAISEAKKSFFSLDQKNNNNNDDQSDDLEKLIEDCASINVISNDVQYVNLTNERETAISATSSASGSSSITATPSSSPMRDDRTSSRKNSEGSNRSKSPKFTLPEITSAASPSQAVYMSTTVPQNIKGSNIMGRHKPTRNSLRHSRLIVKNFQGSSHSNSLNIRHVWLAKFVLSLKIVIGLALLMLAAWITLFSSSAPISQNPFWSGSIIIISGLLGLYLLTFKRSRSKLKMNFFWFLKMNATVIIILSVFLTTLALIYATFHYISLTSDNKKCFPENIFVNSSSCICVFNVKNDVILSKEITRNDSTGTMDTNGHIDIDGKNVIHFRDLSCNELSTWTHILLTSMILNFIGLLLAVCYLTQFIFGCKRRKKKRNYLTVRNGA